jgi:RES domain-containing protein
MNVAVWRIAAEENTAPANDMSGAGAQKSGGRWNSLGTPMVYCSSSIALATLETLSHVRFGRLPFNRFLIRIDIPTAIWARRELLALPGGWDAVPSGLVSRKAGDAWISSDHSALLVVPSVIVPEESNLLINPLHADMSTVVATTVRKWIYDYRFF